MSFSGVKYKIESTFIYKAPVGIQAQDQSNYYYNLNTGREHGLEQ